MIKPPPRPVPPCDLFRQSADNRFWQYPARYLALHTPLDEHGRYLPYDQLRHRWPPELDPRICWSLVKSARSAQQSTILISEGPTFRCTYLLTPLAQRAITCVDRHTTMASLEHISSHIGENAHFHYLLNDLIEDEAISSSQLEGAATTTKVAKDMLKRNRQPRTPDERMIIGNFRLMLFVWEKRTEPLSVELIAELHAVGVGGIDDSKYSPGIFRLNDDVVVQDGDGNTVHVPPPAVDLKDRLQRLADWINTPHHDLEHADYLHPLIKAIGLHFAVGYEHPFRDGNGRVARALFYWHLFRHGFSAFRYIAISVLLRNAPIKYGRSYLHSEMDEMDLTYFIDYQCSIVMRAVSDFLTTYKQTVSDALSFDRWLEQSTMFEKLTDKQKAIFQVALNGIDKEFTAVNVKENLKCSYNTASAALNGLAAQGAFEKNKVGREWVFTLRDRLTLRQMFHEQ
jgi:Fic family protein